MFKIGHYTDTQNLTGCTVILMPKSAIGSCYVAGSSPGTREIELLSPERKINEIHAVLLTGGSAFGLNAAAGVVKFLEEKNIGYKTKHAIIPIVPAAVIYDLNIGNSNIRPEAENAYIACQKAEEDNYSQGNIGAGTGATVGKWAGISHAMKGGLGIAELEYGDVFVRALSVVNAVGDIIDKNGKIISGAINSQFKFLAEHDQKVRWQPPEVSFAENTVLSVIMTNAKINKLQAYIISKKSTNGLSRSILPANTNYDGDVIFTFSNCEYDISFDVLIEISTEALRQSILNAVESVESAGNFLGFKNLKQ